MRRYGDVASVKEMLTLRDRAQLPEPGDVGYGSVHFAAGTHISIRILNLFLYRHLWKV
jgi:hypothetical protein